MSLLSIGVTALPSERSFRASLGSESERLISSTKIEISFFNCYYISFQWLNCPPLPGSGTQGGNSGFERNIYKVMINNKLISVLVISRSQEEK